MVVVADVLAVFVVDSDLRWWCCFSDGDCFMLVLFVAREFMIYVTEIGK